MCGIAGFYHASLSSEAYPSIVKKMLSLIQHRGPDEAGYYVDDHVAMGTTRLSIIDLKSGSQPLSEPSQRYWICYNGELYNYKELRDELQQKGYSFATQSDTEVVLQAWVCWKEACLSRFNGAFAFAIYDSHEVSLFLARDRYGKRPLFYTQQDGEFLFASGMKAFLGRGTVSFDMDPVQIASILAVWTPLPHQTGFKHIHQLPMGEYLVVKGAQCVRKRYETLRFDHHPFEGSEAEALEQVRTVLTESVRLRMRSDVEVGVYLSGGLDSSIVTQLVTGMTSQRVHTFSVEFEDKQFDESAEQQLLAQYLGTSHAALRISHRDIADNFSQAMWHAEIPAFRTAFVPMYLLSQKVQEAGIKVVLSGEGADEAFLGYDIFKDTLLRTAWHTLTTEERKGRLAKMYPYLSHFNGEDQGHLLGLYQQFSEEQMPGLFSHEMRFQNGRFSTRLLQSPPDPFAEVSRLVSEEASYAAMTPVQKTQWLEFKTLLSGYLLSTQGERMGLAHGVENRCPFLDPHVVALASSVNLRFNDGFNEKYVLKKAFADRLPDRITNRHKHPYRAPDSAAFVDHRPDYLEAVLSDAELQSVGFLNTNFIRALTKKIFSTPASQISTKENQTFIFLLSIVLLHRDFVKGEGLSRLTAFGQNRPIESILVKAIDRRQQTHASRK